MKFSFFINHVLHFRGNLDCERCQGRTKQGTQCARNTSFRVLRSPSLQCDCPILRKWHCMEEEQPAAAVEEEPAVVEEEQPAVE